MRKDIVIMLVIYVCIHTLFVHAQSTDTPVRAGQGDVRPLLVGELLPDEFWTKEYLFYINGDTVRKDLSAYKGKLLVLDYWSTWCAICLWQMRDKQQLFAKYPKEMALLLVNPSKTKDDYKSIRKKQDIIAERSAEGRVESIIEDVYIQALFPAFAYPTYVWIGPRGDLIATTTALSVTDEHVMSLLKQYGRKETVGLVKP